MVIFFPGLLATIPTSQNSTTILNPNRIKKEKATSPKQYNSIKKCNNVENGVFSIPETPVKKEYAAK